MYGLNLFRAIIGSSQRGNHGKDDNVSDTEEDTDTEKEEDTEEEVPDDQPSLFRGSDEYFETECEPCRENGNFVKAQGYCTICKEFMCQNCIMYHKRMKISKNHKIQGPDEMPKDKPSDESENAAYSTQNEPASFCTFHKTEVIKYFCKDHKTVCCVDCVTMSHRSCNNILLVNVVCNDDSTSAELRKFFQRLDVISNAVRGLLDVAENNRLKIEEQGEKLLHSVRTYKDSIIETINKFVKAIETEVEAKMREDQVKTEQLTEKCSSIQEHIGEMSNSFERLRNNSQQSEEFILMNQSEKQLDEWERKTQEMKTYTHLHRDVFCPSLKLSGTLAEITYIGCLVGESDAEQCEACKAMVLKTNMQSLSCDHCCCDVCIPVATDNKRTCPLCGTVTEKCRRCRATVDHSSISALACGHGFCRKCTDEIIENRSSCPNCGLVTAICRRCKTAEDQSYISSLACGHAFCVICRTQMIENKSPCAECGLVTVKCERCQTAVDQTSISSLACGHEVCLSCRKQQTENEAPCTNCGMITGNQPEGSLSVKEKDGYRHMNFKIPSGNQMNYHPCPGKTYKGQELTCTLLNDEKGRQICQMLRTAFDRKLVFKIDQDMVTPNIELYIGPVLDMQSYKDYIGRITERLKKLGIAK